MRRISDRMHKYYFSRRLKELLDKIQHFPLTVVEAPSGFGKTTAIKEYLDSEFPGADCKWYTCMGEPAFVAWMRICSLFSGVDSEVAGKMKGLKTPTMETLFDLEVILQNLNCKRQTFLIIDNYQLIDFDIHQELLSVFSMHDDPKLHLIFITQQLPSRHRLNTHNNNILSIQAPAFFFDREGVARLFRLEGLRLTDEELNYVMASTEGWISAIRLQMANFKESGTFVNSAGVEQLVETAVWNKLTPAHKDFFLSVCVLDCFSPRQAASMMDGDVSADEVEAWLRSSDFIRYMPDNRLYIIHSILLDYLRNRFYHHQTKEYQDRVYNRAGLSCAIMAKYYSASEFFYKVKNFDAILSLPFSCEYFYRYHDKHVPEIFEALINECPRETLCKHPFTLLVLGYQAFASGQYSTYTKICELLGWVIESANFDGDQLRRIRGEYIHLTSIRDFNDIPKQLESLKTSWEILGGPSEIVNRNSIWGYAVPSVLSLLWRNGVALEDTLRQTDEASAVYYLLTGGLGAGAKSALRAEAHLMRGEDDEAELLCHKALYDARNHGQISICLSAELVLARIAILRGDAEGFFAAVRNIQSYAKENPSRSLLRMAEHCMSAIGFVLGIKEYAAHWLYDTQDIRKTLYAPAVPMAEVLHQWLLIMDKRYSEFYALSQFSQDPPGSPSVNVKYRMPRLYELILMAAAKRHSGKHPEAHSHLKEALELALPDRVYLPFAEQEGFGEFLSGAETRHLLGAREYSAPLLALCKRQQKGVAAIRKVIHQSKSTLTPREREIALLAKERMSRKEIAEKLFISQATVQSTLRSVYSKLDIHSKNELMTREF